MDRRSATPEDLPPLTLSVLRELDLDAPPGPGRAAHISAGSGVARRGDFVYVIGDDELGLGVFRLSKEAPGDAPAGIRRRAERRIRRAQEGEAGPRGAHPASTVQRPAVRCAARAGLRLEPATPARFRMGASRGRFTRWSADRTRPLPAVRAPPRNRARAEHRGGLGARQPAVAVPPRQYRAGAKHRRGGPARRLHRRRPGRWPYRAGRAGAHARL